MDPAEPAKRASSRTPTLHARGSDLVHIAHAVEGLFDLLARCASTTYDPIELQVQLGEFRDEHHHRLEHIMRTYKAEL